MVKMLPEIFLLAVTSWAISIGYELSLIKVPPGFKKPLRFKINTLLSDYLARFAKLKSHLTGRHHVTCLRETIATMISIMRAYEPGSDLIVTNEMAGEVPIRVFRPRDKESETLPVLIHYHGGAYVVGNINDFNFYMEHVVRKLQIVAITVDYRLAPEFEFPIPVNDCWNATNYIIDNCEKLRIDPQRIALSGDSAGGNAVAVITQRFAKQNKPYPKLQLLMYPWLQVYNYKLPSYLNHLSRIYSSYFSIASPVLTYFGQEDRVAEKVRAFESNLHTLAIEDEALREKYDSYLNVDVIPEEYKKDRKYYELYYQMKQRHEIYPKQIDDEKHIINTDKRLRDSIKKMCSPDMSPLLVDDELLRKLPKAYFCMVECDAIKDEGLIYAGRLRRNGVNVKINYYTNGFHGIVHFVGPKDGFEEALKMRDDLIEYLRTSL